MKTVLITGAAGFIGSHLSELLLTEGYNVLGVDNFDPFYDRDIKISNLSNSLQNQKFDFIELDICNLNELLEKTSNYKIDVVVHIAAKAGVRPSIEAPDLYIQTNIVGSYNILEFMKIRSINKMVFTSSSSVYGNSNKTPFSEEDKVDYPISPYAMTKKSSEMLNYTYHHLYKFDIINLRLFTVYGPRQRPDLAIHKFINLIKNNKPIFLYGDGSTSRDYTYISDVVNGFYLSIKHLLNNNNVFETLNIGNGSPVSLLDMVIVLEDAMKTNVEKNFKSKQPGDVDITFASIEKAKTILNYNPQVTFRQGISLFVEWHKKQ